MQTSPKGNRFKVVKSPSDEASSSSSRRFKSAVMFTDVVGFTAMMHSNENETIRKIEVHRKILERTHRENKGIIIQYYGDGSLSIFDSSVQAVRCAIEVQSFVKKLGLPVRIGIHWGEIVEKGEAIYGDCVNLASRIESIGAANSILISEDVLKDLGLSPEFEAVCLGNLQFKHIQSPVKVFALKNEELIVPDKKHLEGKLAAGRRSGFRSLAISLGSGLIMALGFLFLRDSFFPSESFPENISTVGIIPFEVMYLSDEGPDYFLDGFTDDLVTQLSSKCGLKVISSHAAKSYLSAGMTPRMVGKELGATHLVYGSVRQLNDTVRLNIEVVDAKSGQNVFASQYDRPSGDLLSFHKEVTREIAHFLQAEENPFQEIPDLEAPTKNMEAYRLYMHARKEASADTEAGLRKAIELLEKSTTIDPDFGLGYAWLAQCYTLLRAHDVMDPETALDQARLYLGLAYRSNRGLAEPYVANALLNYMFYLTGPEEILSLCQQAMQLRPSHDYAYFLFGRIHFDLGNFNTAEEYFNYARQLNPGEFVYEKMYCRLLDHTGNLKTSEKAHLNLVKKHPEKQEALSELAMFYLNTGDIHKTLSTFDQITDPFVNRSARVLAFLKWDELDKAGETLFQITREFPDKDITDLAFYFYDAIGKVEKALEILETSFVAKRVWIRNLNHYPPSVRIQQERRYQQVLQHAGLDRREISYTPSHQKPHPTFFFG